MFRPVTLCLNVDAVEAECILADDSVQALIASPPQVLRRSCGTAVTHGSQHIKDEMLQKRGLTPPDAIEHLRGDGGIGFLNRSRHRLSRCGFGDARPASLGLIAAPRRTSELDEFFELAKDAEVYAVRMLGQNLPASLCDLYDPAPGPTQQTRVIEVRDGPVHPVGEQEAAAGDGCSEVFIGQIELTSKRLTQLRDRLLLAICQGTQDRSHE